jgi:hypothetical protein
MAEPSAQNLNFDASKHPLVFATESYRKENGHANCPRDPIMNLIESRRNRGDGRKVLLGRIIEMVAPIRRHFLSLLVEGPALVLRNHILPTVHHETSDIIIPRIHFAEKIPHSTNQAFGSNFACRCGYSNCQ